MNPTPSSHSETAPQVSEGASSLTASLPALLAAALLAACGGGNSSNGINPATPGQAVITGRAVDGPLSGATACYDINTNGRCDSDEPQSAPTGADGGFSISVPPSLAGRHSVVVEVPASAVDADTGAAVGVAFTLRAPATGNSGSHAVFVSPLTTLVQAHMDSTGVTLEQARTLIQQQAGIDLSPLADFTQDSSPAARQTARVARLVQLTANEQRSALANVVGTPDRSGTPVTEADVEREVLANLVAGLPLVAGTLTDPLLVNASGATLQTLLMSSARSIARQLDLSADSVRAAATLQRLAEPPQPLVPVASATLRGFRFTDDNTWFFRVHQLSAEDTVPDANGYARYYDWFVQSALNPTTGQAVTQGGVVQPGSNASSHWNGTAWVQRFDNQRYLTRIRDAQGRGDYNFGDGLELGTSIRRVEDISGLSIREVVRSKIRTFPGSSNGVTFANWGPSDLNRYGGANFPAGSYLIYQTTLPTSTAVSYTSIAASALSVYAAAVAAGGDVRVNTSSACNDTAANIEATLTPAATLEDLMTRNRGTPCIYAQSGQSLSPDEWWGNSTLNVGDLAGLNTLPPNTGSTYTTTANVRVSFSATGNRATFWRCYRRVSLNSPRNCTVLGLATWSIQTMGDARVLGFSTAPALAQRLGTARVFVERGGRVYAGNKSPVGLASTDLRLNLTAANAVMFQLGLPRIKPVTAPGTATGDRATTLATLRGAWGEADATNAIVWRFGPDGRFFMAEAKPFLSVTREQSGAELGWFDHDPVSKAISTTLQVDSNLTSGTSHPNAAEFNQPYTITPTSISAGSGANGVTLNRLPTTVSQTSLLGMWAFDSATDLSTRHLVFFGNGRFMLISHSADPTCPAVNQCPPGVEFGQYTYDAATGALTLFNPLYDTNGCEGAFESCAAGSNNTSVSVTSIIAPDGLTATVASGGNAPSTIYRVAAQASN